MVGIRRSGRQVTCPALLLALLVALVGCSPSPPLPSRAPVSSSPRPALPTVPTRPLPTVVLAPTRSPGATPTWLPTATPTRLPTATSSPTPVPVCYFDPEGTITSTEPLRGVIIFIKYTPSPMGIDRPQLWAVSPDRRQIGRLTSDGGGIGFYAPSIPPPDLILLSIAPPSLESERVWLAHLPVECNLPVDEPARVDWFPCSDYLFSPDGRWVAFFWGREMCGRGILVMDIVSGEVLFRREDNGGGHWFRFLPAGRMLIAYGSCGGGGVRLFDLGSKQETMLGSEGEMYWNTGRTAFAVEVSSEAGGWENAIWGYNVAANSLFMAEGELSRRVDDRPLWTPDGSSLLYQHRIITHTGFATVTLSAREIRIVDAASGEERALIADPRYDYHLCSSYLRGDCQWVGNWLMVRRVPFHPGFWPSDPDWYDPAVTCAEYAVGCPDTVERLALNWRTGELLTWEQVFLPTPAPTSLPTLFPTASPALDSPPLYTDPAGRYALYVGTGGTGLWCVPAGGAPVRWIAEGYHFIYIP